MVNFLFRQTPPFFAKRDGGTVARFSWRRADSFRNHAACLHFAIAVLLACATGEAVASAADQIDPVVPLRDERFYSGRVGAENLRHDGPLARSGYRLSKNLRELAARHPRAKLVVVAHSGRFAGPLLRVSQCIPPSMSGGRVWSSTAPGTSSSVFDRDGEYRVLLPFVRAGVRWRQFHGQLKCLGLMVWPGTLVVQSTGASSLLFLFTSV